MLRELIQTRNIPERNKGKYPRGLESPKTVWLFDTFLKRTDFVVFETILQIRGLIDLSRHTKHITLRHARTNPPLYIYIFSWMFNGQIGLWFGSFLHDACIVCRDSTPGAISSKERSIWSSGGTKIVLFFTCVN